MKQDIGLTKRPPIVSVLGHVDHGKTSLLDRIRQTSVAAREAGGITQSIGATSVTTKDGHKITFIDTPGHAAFSKMRSRGAKVADIVILVVAADDGVKPQTKEAIEHIRESKTPFIIAFTKIDLPSASVEVAQASLEQEGVYLEGRGGDTPYVAVSSKLGTGIDELLELIVLMAEVNGIKSDPKGPLEAVVIETSKDKRGTVASVVVRNGNLKVGDEIESDNIVSRVKGLFNETGESVREVKAGEPTVVLGFSELPVIGSVLVSKGMSKSLSKTKEQITPAEVGKDQIAVFIKAKTKGSLEAIQSSIPEGGVLVGSGIGDVTESDIAFAKTYNAYIFSFEAKIPSNIVKLAKTEGVKVESFKIIYELQDKITEILQKGKSPIRGEAQILAVFPYENKKVAGSKIIKGIITKKDKLTLTRNGEKLGEVKIISMKKGKNDILEAREGEELGILFVPPLAFEVGDVLVSA